MKRQILKAIGRASLAFLLLAVFAQVRASAQDKDSAGRVNGSGANKPNLVGSWDVQVTITDCQTGTALFGFPAMMTYNQDGTMQETDLGGPGIVRLPGHGVWERQNGRQYAGAFRFLIFAPDRTLVGTNVVRSAISLSQSGNEYTSTDIGEFLDANGNSIGGGCGTQTATRFQ